MGSIVETLSKNVVAARLRTLGFLDADLERPRVAICNSHSDITLPHRAFPQIAQKIREGVVAAGGIPIEFGVIATCDGIAHGSENEKYVLPARDLIADSIETFINGHGVFDALVCIGACDKTLPGMLLAAVRHNVPTVLVPGAGQDTAGNISEGRCACARAADGPKLDVEKVRDEKYVKFGLLKGLITETEFRELYYATNASAGLCRPYATAGTMSIFCEALGMSLLDSALLPELSTERMLRAKQSGIIAVELARAGQRPRDVITRRSIENALRCVISIAGSMNCVLHALALANAAGLPMDYADVKRLSDDTPFLVDLKNKHALDFSALREGGGVFGILKQLGSRIFAEQRTVNLATVGELVNHARVSEDTILPVSRALAPTGAIRVLRGSLVPDGALFNVANVSRERLDESIERTAVVYESIEDFTARVQFQPPDRGAAIIIRNEGPQGGPGMRELHRITEWVAHLNLDARDLLLITDGRYSGASTEFIIGYAAPESAVAGSPLSLVRTGDHVSLCVQDGRLDLLVPERELEERRRTTERRLQPIPAAFPYLRRYRMLVSSATKGAVVE